jgi:hypothetical protein
VARHREQGRQKLHVVLSTQIAAQFYRAKTIYSQLLDERRAAKWRTANRSQGSPGRKSRLILLMCDQARRFTPAGFSLVFAAGAALDGAAFIPTLFGAPDATGRAKRDAHRCSMRL